MRIKQFLTVALATVAGVAPFAVITAPAAQAATTTVPLPIAHYAQMLVDQANKHLFISGGAGSSSILVTDYSGQTVATIPNEPGATGLALSSDGSTVYAALANGDAVSAISTSTLTETARYDTGTGTQPTYVACTSGKIWFGYGGAAQGGIGSIDPGTSPPAITLNAAAGNWYAAPILAATSGGDLVAGEPGQSPVQLASYDVSSGTATVLAPEEYLYNADNLGAMKATPDGKDVVLASGYPYYHQVYRVSDLAADGVYQTTNYPNSVSIAGDGTVAAGTDANNEVFVFAPGGSTPLNTYNFGSNWLAGDGVAITPDGSLLFAVTLAGGPTGSPTLNIIPNPEQPPPTIDPTSTTVSCSPGTVTVGEATTCTVTVTDTASSPSTPTGTVTFSSDTSGGSFSGSSCTLSAAGTAGQASCSVSYTPGQAGTETITGSYGGDGTHNGSSGQDTITVTLRATSTSVTCQQVKPVLDKCTATVSDTSPGAAITPTGTVSFSTTGPGVFSASQCTLSGSGSSASCAVNYETSPGAPMKGQTIYASYGGDSAHQASNGSITLT